MMEDRGSVLVLALDFKFCLGEIEAGGQSLVGEVRDQDKEPLCVPFGYSKTAEITERVYNINNGIDPELVIPIDPFELEKRFVDKFPDPSGDRFSKDPGLHKVLHMGLILRSEGIQRIDVIPEHYDQDEPHKAAGNQRIDVISEEESQWNDDESYKAADVSSIPSDAFEQICQTMAEGVPLLATYLVGKNRGRLPYCKICKSPSMKRFRRKKAKLRGHAVVLIGAGMKSGKRHFYFLNSWGKRFCPRKDKIGKVIRAGIGKLRETDLTKNVIKLSPPNETGGERSLEDQSEYDISNINYILMTANERQSTSQMLRRLREDANDGYIRSDHFYDGLFHDDEGMSTNLLHQTLEKGADRLPN